MTHLLPPNATPAECSISESIGRFAPARLVETLWNADTCPEAFLPYLAWALSVDDWDSTWPVQMRRDAITQARAIHQKKGTLSAIRLALTVVGHADAEVIERADCVYHDGSATRNGYRRRGGPSMWATYRVVLTRPVTLDQSVAIFEMLDRAKRNCVHLVGLDFSEVALRHNGAAVRDGNYTRGVIN
jgi:phage tail P2-like protein